VGNEIPFWIDPLQQTIGGAPIVVLDRGLEDDPAKIIDRLRSRSLESVDERRYLKDL
jgi:hypothetical protein